MTEKVFINSENKATFLCPKCGNTRTIDVTKYLNIETTIRIKCKCKCGCTYSTVLERRHYFRKEIRLPGIFTLHHDNAIIKGLMNVTDISRTGLRMEIDNTTDIQIGDYLNVEFRLEDAQRTEMNRQVVVRTIKTNIIGVEFTSHEQADRLGYYLMQ
ncbi:MAG: PilZ domain-containing protein [Desulfobacterales bacterium]|nr:PilZ domain-containing protein [Desulfobacterales bacterium]